MATTRLVKICITLFWYDLVPKLKLFWKGNAMKLKIGDVNVELFGFFLGKNTILCLSQILSDFWG